MRLYVNESKRTVLHSGFLNVDTGFQVLDFGFFVSRSWIPGFRSLERFQIPLSCIPDSFEPYSRFQSSASGFYKQKLPRFQVFQATIPESLTWGEK